MNLLILGGTGGVGKHLVELALAAGHDVTVLARNPAGVTASHSNLHVVKGLATVEAELAPAVAGKDAVLSAIGPRAKQDPVCPDTAAALVAAMKQHGVKRVVWVSASGVGDSRQTANDASFVFGRIIPLFLKHPYANHGKAEEILRASDLEWTVVRPLQLTDKPSGKPPSATLPGVKPGSLKIARRDVAAFMLDELAKRAYLRQMPLVWT